VPDYGHDLEFGVFLPPDAVDAARTLELAQLADVLGYDLVTVQDHPYQAKHLDAWTLLTAVAARTSAVRVAPNVANLPLRPPAVLAQAVASLDILSDGRAELGLGAGAFWDAVVAAGGPRRSPGEAVEALEEAIAVIRGVWGVAGNRTVDVDGRYYQVKGMHAGPPPVHDIGIWIGALKPRMLRLTGRLADGWLPSLGRVSPDTLGEMNAVIDEAADRAGRAPQAVRRMLNVFGEHEYLRGPSAVMAERLAALTLEHGTSTFILGTGDPDELQRFAAEVMPAVRDLVDLGRGAPAAPLVEEGASPLVEEGAPAPVTKPAQPNRPPLPAPTPDDGHRLSARLPWDEATRPAAPASQAPYLQPTIPQHLVDIHDHLRGELAQVRDIVDQVRRGQLGVGAARSEINTMTMRQNNWTLGAYCESYCRVVTGHHALEDRSVFTHLRRSEPDLGAVLDRLSEEHLVIHDVLEQVDDALVGLVGAPPYGAAATAALDEIQRALDLLTATLLSHLAYEERELIPPLARHGFM
jgi:alkanesulfonate monooxygenase SsuD/methylene tetrahydromethanopterin reductase-like flavin-dependent oxidoreductase (luciferase family)